MLCLSVSPILSSISKCHQLCTSSCDSKVPNCEHLYCCCVQSTDMCACGIDYCIDVSLVILFCINACVMPC